MSRPTKIGNVARSVAGLTYDQGTDQEPTPDPPIDPDLMPDRGLNDPAFTNSLTGNFPAVAVTQDTIEGTAPATTINVTMPAGISVNPTHALLAVIVAAGSGPAISFSGWSLLDSDESGGVRTSIFGRDPDGTEGVSMPATVPSAQRLIARVFRITGCDGLAGLEADVTAFAATSSPNPPSLNPSGWGSENTLWMAVVGGGDGGHSISAYPTNYTDGSRLAFGSGPADGWLGTCRRELAAASEDPGAFTLSASNGLQAATIAIRPSGAVSTWTVPQPRTGDGDDATATDPIPGPELLQRDLIGAYRIARNRIRLETDGTGSRTLTIEGWNELDESDIVTVTTTTFTATGSAQDVEWVEVPPDTPYRYYRLSSSSSEDVIFYSWEMYEPTLLQSMNVDHPSLTDRDLANQHPADAVSYDNGSSGLSATDVQAAIDEVAGASAGISVTDGTTTVSPATSVSFDAGDFDVTSPGGGVAAVAFIGGSGSGVTDHGFRAGNSTQSVGTSSLGTGLLLTATDSWDTDAYHFTSDAALSGTVSKTNGSPTITGSSTSFTTELSVNQVITIPGTSTQVFVVKTITSNTSLEAWQNATATASGQTATRRSQFVAIPAGRSGRYHLGAQWRVSSNSTGYRRGGFRKNSGTLNAVSGLSLNIANIANNGETTDQNFSEEYTVAEGDYFDLWTEQTSGGNRDYTAVGFWGHQIA